MTEETLIRHSHRIQKAKKSITKNLDKLNSIIKNTVTNRKEFFSEIMRPNDRCMDAVAKCVEAASAVTGVVNEKLSKYENHLLTQLETLKASNNADGHYTWKELEGAFDNSPRNRKKTTGETVNDAARKIWDEDIVVDKTARDLEWFHACQVISRTEESAVAIALKFMLAKHITSILQHCDNDVVIQNQLFTISDETVKSLVVEALKASDDTPKNKKTDENIATRAQRLWDKNPEWKTRWDDCCSWIEVLNRTDPELVTVLQPIFARHIVDIMENYSAGVREHEISIIKNDVVKALVKDVFDERDTQNTSGTYDVPKVERLWKEIESYNDEPGATIAWATDKINHEALDNAGIANELRKRLVDQVVSTLRVRCNDNHDICCFIDAVEDDETRDLLRREFASLYTITG